MVRSPGPALSKRRLIPVSALSTYLRQIPEVFSICGCVLSLRCFDRRIQSTVSQTANYYSLYGHPCLVYRYCLYSSCHAIVEQFGRWTWHAVHLFTIFTKTIDSQRPCHSTTHHFLASSGMNAAAYSWSFTIWEISRYALTVDGLPAEISTYSPYPYNSTGSGLFTWIVSTQSAISFLYPIQLLGRRFKMLGANLLVTYPSSD